MTVFIRGDRERLTSEMFHFYLNKKNNTHDLNSRSIEIELQCFQLYVL